MQEKPPFYNRPPIVERVATVYCDMSEEVFESRFDEWEMLVKSEYPVYEPLKEWALKIRELKAGNDRIPILDSMEPEVRITPRFSQKSSAEGFDWSIRCPRGQFTMNMHSSPDQSSTRRYKNLRQEFARWLPKWMQHFGVDSPKLVSLHYVNELSRKTVPQFYSNEGQLLLGHIITLFSNIPGEHECIIPPYECTVTVKLREKESFLRISVNDWVSPGSGPAVQIDFLVNIAILPQMTLSAEDILNQIDWAHDRIIERFEVVFSEVARTSFEPVA